MSWSDPKNNFTTLLDQKRRAGMPLVDLSVSNPTETFTDYPHARIREAFLALNTFQYQPEPLGAEAARTAIAGWYRRRGITIEPGQLALTASTSEAYALLFKLLCNPGDEIVVPTPSYPLFDYLALLESVKPVPYRLAYDGNWFIDFPSLQAAISPRTRAIVTVNPNNPTGSFLKAPEAEQLIAIAQQRNLPVISDEVFMDFPLVTSEGRVRTLIGRDTILSFSLNGLSKTAGMPQMKLAWIAMNGPSEARAAARTRLELLLDTYLSVGTPVQDALPDLLEIGGEMHAQVTARLESNWTALATLLESSPVQQLHVEGGWSAILRLPNVLPEETWVTHLLADCGVVVQPGYFFDILSGANVVVSLITPPEIFIEGIRRIRHFAGQV
ncbi:MAG TPA: pyridoxal phosphate-dependent aminotransferase [Bryobacteraceae bacterium]